MTPVRFLSRAGMKCKMNYLLLLGVAVFSSASGAMLVALIHRSRSSRDQNSTQPQTDPNFDKWGYK